MFRVLTEHAGFVKGKSCPCIFWHKEKDVRVVVHGDDFTVLGYAKDLDWFRKTIVERVEVKFRGRIGPAKHDDKSIRLLNRVICWADSGIRYEAAQRHS